MAKRVKIHLPIQEMQETQFRSLGWEDPLEEGMQPTLVLLPGKSHAQGETSGLQLMESQSLTQLSTHT